MKIRFVTSNAGKVQEAKARLGPIGFEIVGTKKQLLEIQADTVEEVARNKAADLLKTLKPPFFIEDAGLHVDALKGFPSTYSSFVFRTIGYEGILKLLFGAKGPERRAHFLAVIAYVDPTGRIHLFSGRADGTIVEAARGTHGFGFDPIFQPDGSSRTFAELKPTEKGEVSHRGRALDALAHHLKPSKTPVFRKKP
jgi:XTP/dITP diphosphohydrolase